jgi:hypothetical protein
MGKIAADVERRDQVELARGSRTALRCILFGMPGHAPAPAFAPVRIGCSGWIYQRWRGLFYPDKLPVKRWFGFYA